MILKPATIVATAAYLPPKRVDNHHFADYLDTSDAWIFERTGIRARRFADQEMQTSDLGALAAERVLEKAGIPIEEVDLLLVATMTPDQPLPSTAALLQSKLPGCKAPGMDISAACSGYLYGLSVAKAFIESGMYKTILFVGCEKMTQVVDPSDRSTAILFGDGAGASIIRAGGNGLKIEKVLLGLDGGLHHSLYSPPKGYMQMQGQEVFKTAILRGGAMLERLLQESQLGIDAIDCFLFHQANVRIIQNLEKRFSIPSEKILLSIEETANTSAASIPILLERKDFQKGERAISIAFGAGFTYAGALLECV